MLAVSDETDFEQSLNSCGILVFNQHEQSHAALTAGDMVQVKDDKRNGIRYAHRQWEFPSYCEI